LSAQEIGPKGKKLAQFLDQTNVEKLWLKGHYVKWESGEPLDKEVTDGKSHTHCSAFAASTAKKLGIYLLRPRSKDDPEGVTGHSENLLANAQYDWLTSADARKFGWLPAPTAAEAQKIANRGALVVAVWKNSDAKKSGHIAIVRPSTRNETSIDRDGPEIIQAGGTNFLSGTLRAGFGNHPEAWKNDKQVRFFRNMTEIELP
jgi:hypothetical protein